MRVLSLSAVTLSITTSTFAAPTYNDQATAAIPSSLQAYAAGFTNPTISNSQGGNGVCISGMIDVTASADNVNVVNLETPANNTVVTSLVQEILQVNSTVEQRYTNGSQKVSGTYSIHSYLCFPGSTGKVDATKIQILNHGLGFDGTYWDVAPGQSYVDDAAKAGITTFFFDHLGHGKSEKPDGIHVTQYAIQVAIQHELIQYLRSGNLAHTTFKQVLGVGHSFGSVQTSMVTALFPKDLDAVALTGFAPGRAGDGIAFASVDLQIASQAVPTRFSGLSNDYLTASVIQGNQFFFFRWPGFDPAILDIAEAKKDGIAIGELLSLGPTVTPALNYTGPVFVINGLNDIPVCAGDCLFPKNAVANALTVVYPNASNQSTWYLVPDCGHGIVFHYAATDAHARILDFFKSVGF